MHENAPPGHGKGSVIHANDEALTPHPKHRRQAEVSTAEIRPSTKLVNAFAKLDRRLDQKKKKRRFAPIGSTRSHQRLREVERVLSWHYGSILPDDDAGRDDLHILLSVLKACGKSLEDAMGFVRKLAEAAGQSRDQNRRTLYRGLNDDDRNGDRAVNFLQIVQTARNWRPFAASVPR